AHVLASAGFDLTLHYRSHAEAAQTLVDSIRREGGKAQALGFDITDRDAAREALEADIEANGAFWGVVLNAGINADNAFPALTGEDWDRVVDTSLGGFYNVLHPLTMPMVRRRR